jgi:hypothetical protein
MFRSLPENEGFTSYNRPQCVRMASSTGETALPNDEEDVENIIPVGLPDHVVGMVRSGAFIDADAAYRSQAQRSRNNHFENSDEEFGSLGLIESLRALQQEWWSILSGSAYKNNSPDIPFTLEPLRHVSISSVPENGHHPQSWDRLPTFRCEDSWQSERSASFASTADGSTVGTMVITMNLRLYDGHKATLGSVLKVDKHWLARIARYKAMAKASAVLIYSLNNRYAGCRKKLASIEVNELICNHTFHSFPDLDIIKRTRSDVRSESRAYLAAQRLRETNVTEQRALKRRGTRILEPVHFDSAEMKLGSVRGLNQPLLSEASISADNGVGSEAAPNGTSENVHISAADIEEAITAAQATVAAVGVVSPAVFVKVREYGENDNSTNETPIIPFPEAPAAEVTLSDWERQKLERQHRLRNFLAQINSMDQQIEKSVQAREQKKITEIAPRESISGPGGSDDLHTIQTLPAASTAEVVKSLIFDPDSLGGNGRLCKNTDVAGIKPMAVVLDSTSNLCDERKVDIDDLDILDMVDGPVTENVPETISDDETDTTTPGAPGCYDTREEDRLSFSDGAHRTVNDSSVVACNDRAHTTDYKFSWTDLVDGNLADNSEASQNENSLHLPIDIRMNRRLNQVRGRTVEAIGEANEDIDEASDNSPSSYNAVAEAEKWRHANILVSAVGSENSSSPVSIGCAVVPAVAEDQVENSSVSEHPDTHHHNGINRNGSVGENKSKLRAGKWLGGTNQSSFPVPSMDFGLCESSSKNASSHNSACSSPRNNLDSNVFRYIGDPAYRNLSVLDNLELYFQQQVFNPSRGPGSDLYMTVADGAYTSWLDDSSCAESPRSSLSAKPDDRSLLVRQFVPAPPRPELFVNLFSANVIDTTSHTSSRRQRSPSLETNDPALEADDTTADRFPAAAKKNVRFKRLKRFRDAMAAKSNQVSSSGGSSATSSSLFDAKEEKLTKEIAEREMIIVVTTFSIYFVPVQLFTKQTDIFADAPLPNVLHLHPIHELSQITVFFAHQRFMMHFRPDKGMTANELAGSAFSSGRSVYAPYSDSMCNFPNEYSYQILTRDKAQTVRMLNEITDLSKKARQQLLDCNSSLPNGHLNETVVPGAGSDILSPAVTLSAPSNRVEDPAGLAREHLVEPSADIVVRSICMDIINTVLCSSPVRIVTACPASDVDVPVAADLRQERQIVESEAMELSCSENDQSSNPCGVVAFVSNNEVMSGTESAPKKLWEQPSNVAAPSESGASKVSRLTYVNNTDDFMKRIQELVFSLQLDDPEADIRYYQMLFQVTDSIGAHGITAKPKKGQQAVLSASSQIPNCSQTELANRSLIVTPSVVLLCEEDLTATDTKLQIFDVILPREITAVSRPSEGAADHKYDGDPLTAVVSIKPTNKRPAVFATVVKTTNNSVGFSHRTSRKWVLKSVSIAAQHRLIDELRRCSGLV